MLGSYLDVQLTQEGRRNFNAERQDRQPAAGVQSMIRTERMNEHFTKLHLTIGDVAITLHHFTGPDLGDPHDHPFAFTTTILAGGYIEEVWRRGTDGWSSRLVHREPGTSHRVGARSIHRIVELPQGECVTSIVWHSEGVQRRHPRFWRYRNGVMWTRRWNETGFKRAALKHPKVAKSGKAP